MLGDRLTIEREGRGRGEHGGDDGQAAHPKRHLPSRHAVALHEGGLHNDIRFYNIIRLPYSL